MRAATTTCFFWLTLLVAGCGGKRADGDVPSDVKDAVSLEQGSDEREATEDIQMDTPADLDETEVGDDPDTTDDEGEEISDAPDEVTKPLPPLPTRPPLARPADPLAGGEVEGCSLYLAERCHGGVAQRCSIYDTVTRQFVAEPDPLLRRAFLFDRWRDLYNSPDGQAVDRDFKGPTPPGTPEEEWARPEHFDQYWGAGDGAIWTGWSTVAAILRYAVTGTRADYLRMEQHVRDLVTLYDVTHIPGYLARFHFLVLPEGAPNSPEHILRWQHQFKPDWMDRPFDPTGVPNLPAIYTEGIRDAEGTVWKGQPMWRGRPSIDQNTGPMTALPMAWDLLQDAELKQRIAHHLTCYLKRLQRVEIIHLQQNKPLLDSLVSYFSAGQLNLDPDDVDLTKLDRIVGYVQRQVNSLNEATFDKSCPATVQKTPWRVIDAASETFLLDILEFVLDMGGYESERANGIDHFYFPSLRGGDAMHLMHLATIAYHFTGDDMYREFLFDELVGNLETLRILNTAGAFDMPKFCKKYYGDQITFGPWWAFIHLLDDSEFKTEVQKAFHVEMWDKIMKFNGNVDFNILYAGALPAEIAKDRDQALAYAMEQLRRMGGNGRSGDDLILDDPRRSYTLTPEYVMAHAPAGIEAVCPTEPEVAVCTQEVDFMGVKLPGLGVSSFPCTGSPWECEVGGGQCTRKMASAPLPVDLRPHTDYLWQRNPFAIGVATDVEGKRQYAGSDLSVPYWNARRYGFIQEGQGQVLAWQDTGACL